MLLWYNVSGLGLYTRKRNSSFVVHFHMSDEQQELVAMKAKFHYLQHLALDMLTLAIKHGDLIPATNCEKCGKAENNRQLDGHHIDYSKPLEVIWLCRSCHLIEHRSTSQSKRRKITRPRIKLIDIAKQVRENGDEDLSVNELMAKYDISQGSTTKIRDILRSQNGHMN